MLALHFLVYSMSLLAAAVALALPQITSGGTSSAFPPNTSISYYQGSTPDTVCNYLVGKNTIQSEDCTPMDFDAISIAQVPDNYCLFTLWSDSSACSDDASQVVTTQIPPGNGSVCIGVGVLDGGTRQKASGMWACG